MTDTAADEHGQIETAAATAAAGVAASGVRDHVLVLPSVICTTLVARRVARRAGAVAISHQDGCGHIGDDVDHSLDLLAALATNPNVSATLVLSLGCETVQGASLADRVAKRGGQVDLVRLQDHGAAGVEEAALERVAALRTQHSRGRSTLAPSQLRIGILADRSDDLVEQFVSSRTRPASTVVAGTAAPTLGSGAAADLIAAPAANAMQRLAALAAAGAHVIVAFPAAGDPPQSLALCPTLTVASASDLHTDLADDFDLPSGSTPDAIWSLVAEVANGRQTAAERLGLDDFSLPRLRRTM